jgi:hypothetical protein
MIGTDIMLNKIESSQIVFFLGAGASKYADVPTTYEFVDKFLDFFNNELDTYKGEEKKDQLQKEVKLATFLIQKLRTWKNARNEKVDIELLLETLTKLQNRETEPLLQVSPDLGMNLVNQLFPEKADSQSDLDEIIDAIIINLKKFIKLKTIVKSRNIEYLQPLRGFIQEARDNGTPLDVISLNYDTCIEQFCNIYKMRYEDGFDINWNPETFNRNGTDIRLYKLHGSAIWYQSDRGTFLKLPIQNDVAEIKLISDESAETLMLYPMQKWDYAEPLLELLVYTKNLLESNKRVLEGQEHGRVIENIPGYFNYKFLMVIGYSFRDEHIKRMVWDISRMNNHLYLIIVDPEANAIFDEIKYHNKKLKIESQLRHKVICLPYKFEEIFPYLRNYYVDYLRKGLVAMDANQRSEYLGKSNIHWIDCIFSLAKAEFCDVVDDIIESKGISFDNYNEGMKLEIFLSMSVNLAMNGEMEKSSKYITLFKESLKMYYKSEVLKYSINPNYIDVEFFRYPDIIKLKYLFSPNFFDIIKQLSNFCNMRLKMCTHTDANIEHLANTLNLFDSYFELFRGETKGYDDYIKTRQELIYEMREKVGKLIFDNMEKELAEINEYIGKIEEVNKSYSESLLITDGNVSPKHEFRDILKSHTEKIERLFLTGLLENVMNLYL